MGLRFVFGPAGSGKSTKLYREIIERSRREENRNFLIIVPDQFTMNTQKTLVNMHDNSGIMNIDVLSFGRLTHRILEEVGYKDMPVLDDTGKSLIISRISSAIKSELPVLGSSMSKQGYVHQVKSILSEFMQYGITPEDVDSLIAFSERKNALKGKLCDIRLIYKTFKEYINDNFITTEEKLDLLVKSIEKSEVLRDAVVVFDGFTGFTPIQYRVLEEIFVRCSEVFVSLDMGETENPYAVSGEQNIFYLSQKTVNDLTKIQEKIGAARGEDIFLKENNRFKNSEDLQFLERNLFRYSGKSYSGKCKCISVFHASNLQNEVHEIGIRIKKLISEGYRYSDIAVISGALSEYADHFATEFLTLGIPVFIDRTRGVKLNPLSEAIKAAIEIRLYDYSYDSVFHYLKSGMSNIPQNEVDKLENYCLALGIRGKRAYENLFSKKSKYIGDDEEALSHLNELRADFVREISHADFKQKDLAQNYADRLYRFIEEIGAQQKLAGYENDYFTSGDLTKAKEYGQIYRIKCDLINQIHELLEGEEITLREFYDILCAGIDEITVGVIPQNVDRVLVGDIERTRLSEVKVLFFCGVNDGNVPKSASKGGIISDMDREFLLGSSFELAPTPRQLMFIQRFYLYMNMTKPKDLLYISYANIDNGKKSIRASYLIDTLKNMFTDIKDSFPENDEDIFNKIVTKQDGKRYLAPLIRDYAAGILNENQTRDMMTLVSLYNGDEEIDSFRQAAFSRYQNSPLSIAVAQALYGLTLSNSVTRLERYASCAYMHFLDYGMKLEEREEFGIERNDIGNIYHEALENFSNRIESQNIGWLDFDEAFARKNVDEIIEDIASSYKGTILHSSARYAGNLDKFKEIILRSVLTLQNQVKKGSFKPVGYEVGFGFADDYRGLDISLSEHEKMHLTGRIDRIDTYENDANIYVKVLDYKSGNKDFDIVALYHGLKLQLVLYMDKAIEMLKQENPDKKVLPGAMLYYHVFDPVVDADSALTEEEINGKLMEALRPTGLVNASPEVIDHLDSDLVGKSMVIPVKINRDGTLDKSSHCYEEGDFSVISDFVSRRIKSIGRNILKGDIAVNPCEAGDRGSCTYCSYKKICGFDKNIPGYEMRDVSQVDGTRDKMEILLKMKEETD